MNQVVRPNITRVALTIALIFATIVCNACSENELKTIAVNVDRLAILIADGREIRDELETQGIIGQDEAKQITQGLLRVNSALKAFNARAQTYKAAGELTLEAKADLNKLAHDIASAATELVDNGTFGIKNADAQVRVNAAIGAIKQVTLAISDTVALIKTKGGQ